jgi:pentatricopeptide repeat protein
MRANGARAATAAAAALRALHLPTAAEASHLEPAFRIWPHLPRLFTSAAPAATPPTTLPQLSAALAAAYDARRYNDVLTLFDSPAARAILGNSGGSNPNPKKKSSPDLRASAAAYDVALKACAAAGQAQRAQSIVSSMWRRGVPVGRVAQGSLLKALCAAGRRRQALHRLKGIPAARLTTMHCNTVLGACAAAQDVETGLALWSFMQRRGVAPDAVTWCEVLRLQGAAGDATAVRQTWEEAQEAAKIDKNGLLAETHSLFTSTAAEGAAVAEAGAMLGAARAAALATSGDVPAALQACEDLMDSLSHLLPQELSLDDDSSKEESHHVHSPTHSRLRASPLDHLRSACNSVLHAAVAARHWALMRQMVATMTSRGLPPDAITYNALFKAAFRRGEGPQPIVEGIAEMRALGLTPSAATFAVLAEAHAAEGDVDGAVAAFEDAQGEGLRPEPAAWAALVRAHAAVGDLNGAAAVVKRMEAMGGGESSFGALESEDSVYAALFDGVAAAAQRGSGAKGVEENLPTDEPLLAHCEVKKAAAEVLAETEVGMWRRRAAVGRPPGPAALAALVRAHAALSHAGAVWALLDAQYPRKPQHTSKNEGLGPFSLFTAPEGRSTAPHPKLPPRPSSGFAFIDTETDVLHALEEATAASGDGQHPRGPGDACTRPLAAGIPCLARSGRWDLILALLKRLSASHIAPDANLYAALVAAAGANAGHAQPPAAAVAAARRIVDHMRRSSAVSVTAQTRVFTAMLRVLGAVSGPDAALDLIQEMKAAGVEPDAATWNALRGCALAHGRADLADAAAREARTAREGRRTSRTQAEPSAEEPGIAKKANDTKGKEVAGEEEHHWRGYYATDDEEEW